LVSELKKNECKPFYCGHIQVGLMKPEMVEEVREFPGGKMSKNARDSFLTYSKMLVN
jgi:hypothetical protein